MLCVAGLFISSESEGGSTLRHALRSWIEVSDVDLANIYQKIDAF